MTLAAELADAIQESTKKGLPVVLRELGARSIERICAGAMSRRDRNVVEALLPDGASHDFGTESDALTEASVVAASAHRALGCDTSSTSPCACAVVAAALTSAGCHDVSGAKLTHSVVWGLEVQLRIAQAMSPRHEREGWLPTGTVGPIGAAVAASLVIGSTTEQLAHAIGIATSLSLGHGVLTGPAAAIHAGKAASNGVLAAHLARSGFSASRTALEGPRGFFAVIAPTANVAVILADLGESWLTEKSLTPPVVVPAVLDSSIAELTSSTTVQPLLVVLRGRAA